jgi:inosine-uridine nucleoside N-ribohydrolase
MRQLLAAAALAALFSVCARSGERVPIILDTDIGTDIDDAFALALALASPEIELRAVTTVSADAYGRALIACRMLEEAGRADVPVAAGRPRRAQPEQKGQYQYGLEQGFSKRPVPELAPEFLYRQFKAEPGGLTLVTVGDLTNAARVITDYPEAKPWIKRIVIMGGAVRVGYNAKPPVVWEWNIRSDIKGAQTVFSSGVPLVVAPLDATTMLKLQEPMRQRIFSARRPFTGPLHALYKLWGKETPTLFDPVAVTLSFEERFCTIEDLRIEVDDGGFTREVKGKPNARVALSIRRDDFLEWYVRRLSTEPSGGKP